MAVNTTEPKIRDPYGSLIDNPNYIRPIVAGVNDNTRGAVATATQDPVLKNTYNNGVNAYGEKLPGFVANDVYKDISFSNNTESPELIAARIAKAKFDEQESNQAFNEQDIRRDILANLQAEIDSTNKLYTDKLMRARVEGSNRLGQSGALQARRGLLGSTFGEAQTKVVSDVNEEVYGAIENERNNKILAMQEKSRIYADERVTAKKTAKREGYDAYIKDLSDEDARKIANAKKVAAEIIASQATPDQVNPTTLDETAKNYGITTNAIKAAYAELKKAKDEADKAAALKDAYSLKPGETRYDATGKVLSELPITPKTEAEMALDKAELAYKNSQTSLNLANVEKARQDVKKSEKELQELQGGTETSNLTYGTPEYSLATIKNSSKYGDKRLLQDERKNISAAKRAVGSLELYNQALNGTLDKNVSKETFGEGTGVITGRLRSLASVWGGDPSAAAVNSIIIGIIPTIARGIFQEVGVLTDNDIALYKRTVPDINKPENANKLIELVLLKTLERSYSDTLITAANNQTNVSNFAQEYESVLKRIDNLVGQDTKNSGAQKVNYQGKIYNVDANGEMTLAQ